VLGERIREKRLEVKLSLKEVAEKTGLTRGFLSQVERDLTEPSISSLRKIAQALNVPIFYFLMDKNHHDPVVRKAERKVLKFNSNSDLILELLSPELNRNIQMVIGRLKPGCTDCDEPITHIGEEIILVLEGKMKFQLGEGVHYLEEGDSIYCCDHIPHRIWSEGDTDLVYVSAVVNATS